MDKVEDAAKQALLVVDSFIAVHRQAAIPALIGACVLWAVDHGGADVVRGSLRNAVKMSHEAERERRKAGT